jgi:excinuclease ABC subunit A
MSADSVRDAGFLDVAMAAGQCKSKGEARRLVTEGGFYINHIRITDPAGKITGDMLVDGRVLVMRPGKKNYCLVKEGGVHLGMSYSAPVPLRPGIHVSTRGRVMRILDALMSRDHIIIAGAREHNLQNITVRIPRNSLTVITGLSGSGKSSLAFDTLFAEGQRRYVESLSAYVRQFLDQMQKPDVDYVEGLSPAISIEQRTAGSNPRSIVATTTEIHDYLRLLYANIGHPHCPHCGKPVLGQSAEVIVEQLLRHPAQTKVVLLAPLFKGKKGQHEAVFEKIRKQGFVRARVDGELLDLDKLPVLDKKKAHSVEVVIDRLVLNARIRSRLTDSVELSLKEGSGVLIALLQGAQESSWVERLYSEKHACPDCAVSFEKLTARHFSFNSPYGACPDCAGLGAKLVFDAALVVPNPELSIEDGAIPPWRRGGRRLILYYKGLLRAVSKQCGFSLETPFKDLPEAARKLLLHGSGDKEMTFGYWRGGAFRKYEKPFEGVLPNLARRYEETDSEFTRQRLRDYMSKQPCPTCKGARLRPEVLACTVGEKSIVDLTRLSVRSSLAFLDALALPEQEARIAGEVIKEIRERLQFLADVGLDYLTLDRESGTLSGGEAQRIRLATQIGSSLVGLHYRDNERLISTLKQLRDIGNTVVVVEHDEETIRAADYVIDLGPGAGRHGGQVTHQGTVAELLANSGSLTARYLNGELSIEVPPSRKEPGADWLQVLGCTENNLKNINVRIPLGLFVCVTGVSGSGKSTLVDDILRKALSRRLSGAREIPGAHRRLLGAENLDKVIVIDQSPIGRTPRSNPSTYTGAFAPIRDLFAALPMSKVRGYGPGRFSFNVKGGRCETCKGDGIIRLEMHFLPDVYVPCEQCRGLRYNHETLEVHYNGKNIAEVLNLTIDEALEFFRNIPAIERKVRTLSEVGLGYIQLGQSATTLSGGEAQRMKLAAELSRQATGQTLYLLDEPTTGLHFADIGRLLHVLERLRDAGNTVMVIEHNLDVIKRCDYIIDLGPEGGDEGGRILVEGSPEAVARCPESYTGQALRKHVIWAN